MYCHQLEGLEVSLSYTQFVLKHYHQPEGLEVSLSYTQFVLKHYHQEDKLITHNCSDSDPQTEGVEVCHTYSHIVSHCFCVVTVKPFPHRPGHMQSFHVQVGADKVTSLLMWRPSDHGSCCELLSVDQV